MRFATYLFGLLVSLTGCTTPDTLKSPWHSDLNGTTCCLDIVHATGKLDGQPYTNSIEALEANRALGRRLFEIDISLTSDNHLVLAHDWDNFKGQAPDLATFKQQNVGYTPTEFNDFETWFKDACNSCLFVTDAKDDFWTFWPVFTKAVPTALRETRFIVQTYSVQQSLKLAEHAPQQKQILTLYLLEELTDADLAELRNHPSLIALTMPMNRVPTWAGRVQRMLDLPVYSHAYPWVMENSLFLGLARAYGVRGFYMD